MKRTTKMLAPMAAAFLLSGALVAWGCSSSSNGAKAKNPCGANPCNPCGADNPCNPCGADNPCNPCGGNPCGGDKIDASLIEQPADWKPNTGGMDQKALMAKAETLWNDPNLGTTNSSCNTCHMTPALYKASFTKPYPHPVEMAEQRAGMDQVTAAEMVQLCMKIPMGTDPLAWDSVELAALTALVEKKRKEYAALPADQRGGGGGNPCGGNPCNPCSGM